MRLLLLLLMAGGILTACGEQKENDITDSDSFAQQDWLIQPPKHGYITTERATKWEEAMLTGNGTIGALVMGNPFNERLVLSHEKLFMPQYPPYQAPDLGANLERIRQLVLDGDSEEAAEVIAAAGAEVGIDDMIWTDPLVPACQLELTSTDTADLQAYNRAVNFETGETTTVWQTPKGTFQRSAFASRSDNLLAVKMTASEASLINVKLRLAQLPVDGEENDEEQDFAYEEIIENVSTSVQGDGVLKYVTQFKKKWEGSLKGFVVEIIVKTDGGSVREEDNWLHLEKVTQASILARIILSYDLPLVTSTDIGKLKEQKYEELLARHATIHSEIFNRFSLKLGEGSNEYMPPEKLLANSSVGKLNPLLVEKLCQAARYILISSTGELPPTLQGIWGGTWLPAWSGDFTLNGNVPSAIASGLNTNLQEVTEAYMNYMYSLFEDFKANAQGLFGAPGIFVPSRTSSSGSTYHFAGEFPHLFWFAGNSWTSQFFYDYWQYTGDEQFLQEKVIPFMEASIAFYEFILTRDKDGKYAFIPSYSPEIGPVDEHPLSINATMDIAGLKQLLRNLITLSEQRLLESDQVDKWKEILENLPPYAIDEDGDLKEWIWPGFKNENAHRHASHLYPLFYEVDPAFKQDAKLIEAAKIAIEKRMQFRRANNGAEMAFGLVQKGLAAAHIGDTEHAYECVDYLCNSYWSPALTAYHDPGAIFNVDIAGGLPALVTEMIIQSSADEIVVLPALPSQWPSGEIRGVRTRCGVMIDLVWADGQPVSAELQAGRKTQIKLMYEGQTWNLNLSKGQTHTWEMD